MSRPDRDRLTYPFSSAERCKGMRPDGAASSRRVAAPPRALGKVVWAVLDAPATDADRGSGQEQTQVGMTVPVSLQEHPGCRDGVDQRVERKSLERQRS